MKTAGAGRLGAGFVADGADSSQGQLWAHGPTSQNGHDLSVASVTNFTQ